MSQSGTAVVHCPLSNVYFSSTEIFRLREAFNRGVKVGLGSDIAGGYELGIQGAMRMSVADSRLREGLLKRESQTPGEPAADIQGSIGRNRSTLQRKEVRKRWVSLTDGSMSGRRSTLNKVRRSSLPTDAHSGDTCY